MGKSRNKEISTALYKRLAPLLPAVKPSSKGGRPRLSDERALNGILFVLRTGTPWEHPQLNDWSDVGRSGFFGVPKQLITAPTRWLLCEA